MARHRRERLLRELDRIGLAGAIVARREHVYYLSGHLPGTGVDALVLLGPRGCALVAPGKASPVEGVEVISYVAYTHSRVVDAEAELREAFMAALEQTGLKGQRVGAEFSHLSASLAEQASDRCHLTSLAGTIEQLRRVKDADEIELIRHGVAMNDLGYQAARQAIRPGTSELEVFAAVSRAILLAHGEPFTMIGDFVSGPRTEGGGGPATDRRLEPGDLFIMDIFPVLRGYKGDLSRNFVVGEPTARQREIHRVLEDALVLGGAAIKPGLRACDLDSVVRKYVADAGYGDNFRHHAGHAIGLGHPERPYIIPADTEELQANQVITLEPGIYISGFGGMRLEQNYLITETGAEPLSTFPLELIACPG
jgi:Xaa-Pro aminopeptidase